MALYLRPYHRPLFTIPYHTRGLAEAEGFEPPSNNFGDCCVAITPHLYITSHFLKRLDSNQHPQDFTPGALTI